MIILSIVIGVILLIGWLVYEAVTAPTVKNDDNTLHGN